MLDGLIISEFMAYNDNVLADEDGDFSDWVEIHNPGVEAVDLDGYYLTDRANDLTKWAFPSYLLGPGGYLLVFASDKDRADPNGQLHTNFKLSGDGEYLGLAGPDGAGGVTVVHEYADEFPQQYTDVSYGVTYDVQTPVLQGGNARYWVPDTDDAALEWTAVDPGWTAADFDDSVWLQSPSQGGEGPTGIGYSSEPVTFNATVYASKQPLIDLQKAEEVLADPNLQAGSASGTASVVNFLETGATGRYAGDSPFPGISPGYDFSNFLIEVTGTVLIPSAGPWTFGVNSNDGFSLDLDNGIESFHLEYPNTRSAQDTLGVFNVSSPGTYDVRLLMFENVGGAEVEFFAAPGSHNTFDAAAFDLVGDVANGGLPLSGVQTDVQAAMLGQNASIWTRVPFELEDPTLFDLMVLDVWYNDGFVAYLNGQEVARRNAPDPIGYDSTATVHAPVDDPVLFDVIDITAALGALQAGTNILAIHGLNHSAGDADFLVMPGLRMTSSVYTNRYFQMPTPGFENTAGYDRSLATVGFSRPGGTFADDFPLVLSTDSATGVIRYTLDGSIPAENSPEYTGPITIDAITQVRAAVFEPTLAYGPVETETYIKLDTDLVDYEGSGAPFQSDLPVVVLDDFGAGRPSSDKEAYMAIFEQDADGQSNLTNLRDLDSRISIITRGSSTGNRDKASYTIEAWGEEEDDDNRIDPFGMPDESDWILYGPYNFDRALIRNPLVYELSNQMGQYAVRTQAVEVFFNMDGGSTLSYADYRGVYIFMEKIKQGPDRVDVAEIGSADNTEPDVSGGYILKIDRADPGDAGFTVTGMTSTFRWVYPKEDEVSVAQQNWVKQYLEDFLTALNSPDFTHPTDGLHYSEYIDVDEWIDHHMLNVLTRNPDAFRLSGYMFKDRNGKLVLGPQWDFDRTMGCDDDPRAASPIGWGDTGGTSFFTWEWFARLFEDPDFWQKYIDRWQELREGAFATANIDSIIDTMAAEIGLDAADRNFVKWTAVAPNSGTPDPSWMGEVDYLEQWLSDRANWIDDQFLAAPVMSQKGGQVAAPFDLTLDVPGNPGFTGKIYYTLDGTDPRAPGGGVAAGALEYTGAVSLDTTQMLTARAFLSGSLHPWSGASKAVFHVDAPAVAGSLAITEINYHPYAPTPAEMAAGFADRDLFEFIELTNVSDAAVSLPEANFLDGIEFQFTLDGPISLGPGERVVLVANQAAFEARYGTGVLVAGEYEGNLNNNGEAIVLSDRLGQPIAEFEFSDGGGWPGRADGTGSSLELLDPTGDPDDNDNWRSSVEYGGSPGYAGSGLTNDVLVNEVLSNTDWPDSDVIELVNPSSTDTIDLSGWYLSDSNNNLQKFRIPDGTILGPGEYAVFDQEQFDITPYASAAQVTDGDVSAEAGDHGDTILHLDGNGWWKIPLPHTITPDTVLEFDFLVTAQGALHAIGLDDDGDFSADRLFKLYGTEAWAGPDGGTYAGDFNWQHYAIPIGSFYTGAATYLVVVNDDDLTGAAESFFDNVKIHEGTAGEAIDFDDCFGLRSYDSEDVWLMAADGAGKLTRFVDHVEFGAAAEGESYGRWPNAAGALYPMATPTLDPLNGANSGPRVGPVVITELLYEPAAGGYEFVELYNADAGPVSLYDPDNPSNTWQFGDGIEFAFPPGTTLAPGEVVLVVSTDEATFRAAYPEVPAGVRIFGAYSGALNNGGERLRLEWPDTPPAGDPDVIPWILADEVDYDNQSPWPVAEGDSLQRLAADAWGNNPASWLPGRPSPGVAQFLVPSASVVARHIFYENSAYDGGSGADALDDEAIAPDKQPLLPGETATLANYTSYSRGINGIMIDILGLADAASLSADNYSEYFEFRVGNDQTPDDWDPAPDPVEITVRGGAGEQNSDRVTIVWEDNAIEKTWLQVIVKSTFQTGLVPTDVFYFGNAIGESGNSPTNAMVTSIDEIAARFNPHLFDPASITDHYDYDRDKHVTTADQIIARQSVAIFDALILLEAPAIVGGVGVNFDPPPAASQAVDSVLAPPATEWVDDMDAAIAEAAWFYQQASGSDESTRSSEELQDAALAQLLATENE